MWFYPVLFPDARYEYLHTFAHSKDLSTMTEKMRAASTTISKAVFPNTTNHYDTLFGGEALKTMDEVAFICATRYSKKRMVTVSSDRVDFNHPIPSGTIADFIANVERVGRTSLSIRVEIYLEEMYSDRRYKAIEGLFTFVAIDENRNPTAVE